MQSQGEHYGFGLVEVQGSVERISFSACLLLNL
jgi:hypothetical protein